MFALLYCGINPRLEVFVNLPLDRLEAEVLELPASERARLAQRLLESLDDEEPDDPAEVAQAWEAEIARRLAELDAGATVLIPAEQVLAELHARFSR
jgi:putative addiction module component (TIGR02574 family)